MLESGLQRDVPLAPYTTLGIGGAARFWLETGRLAELRAALAWAGEQGVPTFVLGGGSNILVSDAGFSGLVVRYRNPRLAWSSARTVPPGLALGACRLLVAGASVPWDSVVRTAVDAGCGGIECLAGIPGTVGAAPVQNIGAYGQELSQTLVAVHALHRTRLDMQTFTADACGMGYRTSHFKSAWRDQWLIVRVDLGLKPGATGHVGYGELKTFFQSLQTPPSIAQVSAAVLRLRLRKSMVLSDATDPNRCSVGSFFMNPIVTQQHADDLLRAQGAGMPVYPAEEGCKLSAAWLIEHAGFGRGYVQGAAGISTRHALALINRGGATAEEMVALAASIRRAVHARFGVALAPEAQLIGFSQRDTKELFDSL